MAIRQVALAGMVSDTSLYNIDGACVVGGDVGTSIPVGTVVRVTEAQPVDGHKVVSNTGIAAYTPGAATGALNAPYGVIVRSHYETPDGAAKAQEAVNVMTHGRIWVRAGAGVTPAEAAFGRPVFVSGTGGVVIAGSGVNSGWTYAGGYIQASDNADGTVLVEVQVKQSAFVTPAA